jgi:hypothetical protein
MVLPEALAAAVRHTAVPEARELQDKEIAVVHIVEFYVAHQVVAVVLEVPAETEPHHLHKQLKVEQLVMAKLIHSTLRD